MDRDELQLLEKIVDQNEYMIAKLDSFVTKTEFEPVRTKLDAHNLFINGNGVKGAKSRLDMLEEAILKLNKAVESTVKFVTAMSLGLFIPLVIWAASMIYQASLHIQTMP